MYIPPHFQWLEARQGANSGADSQGSPDSGNTDPGKDNSGGMSARTNAAIIVCFSLFNDDDDDDEVKLTLLGRCSSRLRHHRRGHPFLPPPYPASNELCSQIHPRETP